MEYIKKPMDYTKTTLGELLTIESKTIRRSATSILKQLQKKKHCMAQVGDNLCFNKAVKEDYCQKHYKMFAV